jgi:hypothetical protein
VLEEQRSSRPQKGLQNAVPYLRSIGLQRHPVRDQNSPLQRKSKGLERHFLPKIGQVSVCPKIRKEVFGAFYDQTLEEGILILFRDIYNIWTGISMSMNQKGGGSSKENIRILPLII